MTEQEEILMRGEFIGVVEDNNDPDKKQRVRIRIPFLHGDKSEIPTDCLPWAQPFRDSDGLEFTIPELNKVMNVKFPTGNQYFPIYLNAQHLNINLQNKIEELDGKDYTSFIALCYNYNTQIFISNQEGLRIMHKLNALNITENDITLKLKDNSSAIYLGDPTANQRAVLGDNLFAWLDSLISVLQAPYLGNAGAPVIPQPALVNVIQKYYANKHTFLSEHIYNVDNKQIRETKLEVSTQIGDNIKAVNKNKKLNTSVSELTDFVPTPQNENSTAPVDEFTNDFEADGDKKLKEIIQHNTPVVKDVALDKLEDVIIEEYNPSVKEELNLENTEDYDELYEDDYDWSIGSDDYDSDYYDNSDDYDWDAESNPDNVYASPQPYTPASSSGSSSGGGGANVPPYSGPIPVLSNPASGNDKKDLEKMIKFLKSLNYVIYENKFELNIVGIRNEAKDKGIVTNKFDDYMWVFFRNAENNWQLYKYNCTTTPGFTKGTKYLGTNKDGLGLAMITYGQYVNTYNLGIHNKVPGYTCLRDSRMFYVRNRINSNMYWSREEIKQNKNNILKSAGTGFNIHHAGKTSPSTAVHNWSEGCQVFSHIKQYDEFINLCKNQVKQINKKKFTYALIPQTDFTKFK